MEIPYHVQVALDISSPITPEELSERTDESTFIRQVFDLNGNEFLEAATAAVDAQTTYSVTAASRATKYWQYLEVERNGTTCATVLCTPLPNNTPPTTTAMSQMLVNAWFTNDSLVVGNQIAPGHTIFGYQHGEAPSTFTENITKKWAEVCSIVEELSVKPAWLGNRVVTIGSNSKVEDLPSGHYRFQQLFLETLSETKNKWRFLSLYQIIEHGYLTEVFNKLTKNFFNSPADRLTEALKSVESELNQLSQLVHASSLAGRFEEFCDKFEEIKRSGNRFAYAIEHSLNQKDQLSGKDKAQKGVLFFYKIRCAIVHSGLSSPIFGAYQDGDSCLESLLPICENIVLDYLGISIA
jgi:hypothetical protein